MQRYLRDNAEDLLVSAVGLDSPHTANVLMQHAVFKDFLQEPGNKELLIEKAGNNAEMLDFIKTGHLKEPGLVGRVRTTISAIHETGRFLYDHRRQLNGVWNKGNAGLGQDLARPGDWNAGV